MARILILAPSLSIALDSVTVHLCVETVSKCWDNGGACYCFYGLVVGMTKLFKGELAIGNNLFVYTEQELVSSPCRWLKNVLLSDVLLFVM